ARSLLVNHRLGALLTETTDCQTAMAEDDRSSLPQTVTVGASMLDRSEQSRSEKLPRLRIQISVPEGDDSTHDARQTTLRLGRVATLARSRSISSIGESASRIGDSSRTQPRSKGCPRARKRSRDLAGGNPRWSQSVQGSKRRLERARA